jgi:hypothetical protein
VRETVNEAIKMQRRRFHKHRSVVMHVLGQRAGVPYEIERSVCQTCGRELAAKPLRRTTAA